MFKGFGHHRWVATALGLAAAVVALAAPVDVAAQSGRATVGKLRIGDESGQTIWEQPAPAGEKLFKAPSGTQQFKVYFDYDGSAPMRAVIKLIAPQGVIQDQQEQELTAAGTFAVDFRFEQPLADQEYLINAYVDVDGGQSLADGLTLLVGEAAVIPAQQMQQVPAEPQAPAAEVSAPGADALAPMAPVAGGPSQLLLLGSGLGVIVLLAIVVWAGMSALKQR